MREYYSTPFPFQKLINKSVAIPKLDLEESIRMHIRSIVLMRVGEFAYDKKLGFKIWDHEREVFYHEYSSYFEDKESTRGLVDKSTVARKHFKDNLQELIVKNELRLSRVQVRFNFEKVDGNMSVYQRKITIEVEANLKSTGTALSPSFKMSILYTPFKVETN